MVRPKRAASQKTKIQQEEEKIDSEDDELNLSEESSGDFSSASSDDWDPSKKNEEETFDGSESGESEIEDEEEESGNNTESPAKQKKSNGNRSLVASLRGTVGNRFKRNLANRSGTNNLQEILQRAHYHKKKSISDVSQNESREKTPDFDCSGGLRLSGTSDSEDDDPAPSNKVETEMKPSSALINSINQASGSKMVDLRSIHDNLQQMEKAKAKLMNYESKKNSSGSQKENCNIADLLAQGEGSVPPSISHKKSSQKRARNTQAVDSESDDGWEEVEDDEQDGYQVPKQGVEIILNDFNQQEGTKKDAKPVDREAQMKRKLNRRKKELQLKLHKVNLIFWIAHGNFVNQQLNDTKLMALALEMLPKNKNHCYPKDQTDLDYFQQITNWFKSTITLRNKNMYTVVKQRPPLILSLALQIKFKAAICRRDYVLIFTILLRAIGIQCRMVQSLVCAPILPPKSELLSLSTKKADEKAKTKSTSNKPKSSGSSRSKPKSSSSTKSSSSKSKSHSHCKSSKKSPAKSSRSSRSKGKNTVVEPLIPQLDGGDDQPSTTRSRKNLKIKALPGYKVDESNIDINKDENHNSKTEKTLSTILKSPRSRSRGPSSRVIRFSLGSPNQSPEISSRNLLKPGNSKKSTIDPVKKVQEAIAIFSPRKTRATAKDAPPKLVIKKTISKNPSEKSQKNTQEDANKKEKDTLQVMSPRRLRSRSRSNDERSDNSAKKKKPNLKKLQNSEPPKVDKNTLNVPSPRRLRSQSRSDDESAGLASKPNLKNLQAVPNRKRSSTVNKEEVETKKAKVPKAAGTKRTGNATPEATKKKKAKPQDEDDDYDGDTDESEKLFKQSTKKKSKANISTVIDRRVLSSDSEADPAIVNSSPSKKSKGIDIWIEVYSEKDQRWISIDVLKGKVDNVKDIVKAATHPVVYVFAWNNDKSLKDVAARYCQNLNTTVRKMRVENNYLNSIIGHFEGHKTARDVKEDNELNMLQIQNPMPTSIAEFKNHPLYALKRHLLKYQAIYPPEPPILGYIREEAIYPRECVFLLHTRETWLKEARVVKLNEEPYKITKTMKWDNVRRKLLKDVPQELFGLWQTKDFEPPVAENGMVPRNAYGNVELFKPSMLPIGTVHLQLPGLNKVCKKIGVDCSQAIVGFDSNGGWPYPVYDGFIVCEEFEEKVIDAWNREQEEQEKKENEKYEKRVYGNWKKLIKGLLIRQRLKNKYNFEGDA